MFRCIPASLGLLSSRICPTASQVRRFSRTLTLGDGDQEIEYVSARQWASDLNRNTIPKNIAQVRYDRSSGKGGQHVNKTNSKATCTWPLSSISVHVPSILHSELRKCRHYVASSDSLQMSSQSSRRQHDNEEECHEKLYDLLRDICKDVIPGKTKAKQKTKVEKLQRVEKEVRHQMKRRMSNKKETRSASEDDY